MATTHDHSGVFGTSPLDHLLSMEATAGYVCHDGPAGSPDAATIKRSFLPLARGADAFPDEFGLVIMSFGRV
ncbi:hypothetical protein [Bifidobacterium apousia]|uniref:hypothetical protein n=1 Tax=Bifidobacterium apousia TaxID=2750996 RepID=UPI0011834596|nr:hypothetical protein [Bifidobacterium apousia]MBI0136833.1 hypothetical protein [Bifidobacterium sp. W8120]